jgi:hypothetical protein
MHDVGWETSVYAMFFHRFVGVQRRYNMPYEKLMLLCCYSIVDCGIPPTPIHGYLNDYLSIGRNATISFQCDKGYFPSVVQNTICTSESWQPNPAEHNCTTLVGGKEQ